MYYHHLDNRTVGIWLYLIYGHPLKYPNVYFFFRWLTILRIGTRKDDNAKDRYPGVFFHSKAGIYVRNHLSGKQDFGGKGVYTGEELKKRSLSKDDWTPVKVSQEMEDDKLMFKVTLNSTI